MSYANLILGSESSKPSLDLKVQSIVCESINCNLNVIDNIRVQTIEVDPPATEITFLNNIDMDTNDILNVGTLQASNIIGNITDSDINVNTISTFDTGKTVIIDDTILSKNLKITDVVGQDSITAQDCLHLQSNQNACLYLQADRDNTGGVDRAFISMSQQGGNECLQVSLSSTGITQFASGNTGNATSGHFQFFTTQFINNADDVPPFTGSSLIMEMDNNEIDLLRNLDLSGFDITAVNEITISTLRGTGGGDIEVSSNLEMSTKDINVNNLFVKGIVANIGQPDIPVNDDLDMQQNDILNVLNLTNTTDNISINPQPNGFLLMDTNANIALNDGYLSWNTPVGVTTPVPGGFQGFLYKSGANLLWETGAGITTLNNSFGANFNQLTSATLTTTNSVTYANGINLVSGTLPAGDYMVQWSCDIANSNGTVDKTGVRAIIDGTTTLGEMVSPAVLANGDYVSFSGSSVQTLTNASHTFNIQILTSNAASTAQLKNQSLQYWRVA